MYQPLMVSQWALACLGDFILEPLNAVTDLYGTGAAASQGAFRFEDGCECDDRLSKPTALSDVAFVRRRLTSQNRVRPQA